jgi:hypothetical protein
LSLPSGLIGFAKPIEGIGKMNATTYAAKDWWVLPLRAKSKEPAKFLRHGYLDATLDQQKIDQWFADESTNVGIGLSQSGLVVLDFDCRNCERKEEFWDYLCRCYESNTYVVRTADGYHIYYYIEPHHKDFKGKIMNGIDIKHKGYVAAPPSIHPTGVQYAVVNDVTPKVLPDDLAKVMMW